MYPRNVLEMLLEKAAKKTKALYSEDDHSPLRHYYQAVIDGLDMFDAMMGLEAKSILNDDIYQHITISKGKAALEEAGVKKIKDLLSFSEDDLLHMPYLGRLGVNSIKNVLAKHNLKLK